MALADHQSDSNSSTCTSQVSHPDPVDARDSFPVVVAERGIGARSGASSKRQKKKKKPTKNLHSVHEKSEVETEEESKSDVRDGIDAKPQSDNAESNISDTKHASSHKEPDVSAIEPKASDSETKLSDTETLSDTVKKIKWCQTFIRPQTNRY